MPASPCILVIFGASGDLAARKLLPAMYELARQKLLPEQFALVGFGRSPMTDQEFRAEAREAVFQFARTRPVDPGAWQDLEAKLHYQQGDYGSTEAHARLASRLGEIDKSRGTAGNRLFYLSTPPTQFEPIVTCLAEQNGKPPAASGGAGWRRIIVEKPFGFDLASARDLNDLLHEHFDESDIFRIDHYLGKETVQNLMVMRFANSIFEPIWNYKYIDHVQITVAESLGVGERGGYYDRSGALRDMVQNHMLQLMAFVAMEPPAALDSESIRDEKVKVYRSIRPVRPGAADDLAIRGQYGPTPAGGEGKTTEGYLKEKNIRPDSRTESFVALKLFVDNWRWSGMPFYLRTGKFLPKKLSEIVVRFRSPPLTLFQKQCEAPVYPNDLVIRVQPDEGISLRLNGKVPGGQLNIRPVAMDFLYKTTFQAEPPEAYERLIHDALLGDQTLFIRSDEAEAAWSVIDPIEQGWAAGTRPPEPYDPGSWGPKRAHDLIERDGRRWLHSGDDAEPIIACSL